MSAAAAGRRKAWRPIRSNASWRRGDGEPLTGAFGSRVPVMPWRDATPIPPEEIDAAYRPTCWHRRARDTTVAYLHVPFCHNHCLFCGFFQTVWRPELSASLSTTSSPSLSAPPTPRWWRKARRSRRSISAAARRPRWPRADLARLIEAIRRHLPLAADCEITVEGRIHDFPIDKARAATDGRRQPLLARGAELRHHAPPPARPQGQPRRDRARADRECSG